MTDRQITSAPNDFSLLGAVYKLTFITHDSSTGRSAERVLYYGNSVRLSRPGADSRPGEIETPGFHRRIAQSL